ncbi:pyruvate dehydrogenase (acetyl-transferring) E1 component subunit alpha [Nocardia canadensis]|uniref:pyruvate dehydrogenase (acetyl-transferring) E1 component subunit alpha n=1 Tax=Nocardia canadensis TaxID=3065238 RepID=UPI00292E89D7|nr:pyruvate dehydrogenase (acetyl-transferring) E1 component subunit alpha [Nocardia canadensis]
MTLLEPLRQRQFERYLPAATAVQYLDADGNPTDSEARYPRPADDRLVSMYRNMVQGRRFDTQATALTKQGRLAVYPSARGQEACQIAAAMCLRPEDWLFPTYRDSMALTVRGIPAPEILSMLSGDWHCGYDPTDYRTAPQCTPLATQLLHATGLAYAQQRRGHDTVTLALCGDGATSEGDFHEALNFAAIFQAPVVFLVQNNGFAISVPLARQSAAPSLAHKGVGYGIGSEQVDGNDPVAMMGVMDEAVRYVREGNGPLIVEAHTYRLDSHTNADDATRYRDSAEVEKWSARDPIARLRAYLRNQELIDDDFESQLAAEAESDAADLRAAMNTDRPVVAADLFAHVFADPTPQLREQAAQVRAELAAESEEN